MKLLIKVPVYLIVEVDEHADKASISNETIKYLSGFGAIFGHNLFSRKENGMIEFLNRMISRKFIKGKVRSITGVCPPNEEMRRDYEILHPNSKFNDYD